MSNWHANAMAARQEQARRRPSRCAIRSTPRVLGRFLSLSQRPLQNAAKTHSNLQRPAAGAAGTGSRCMEEAHINTRSTLLVGPCRYDLSHRQALTDKHETPIGIWNPSSSILVFSREGPKPLHENLQSWTRKRRQLMQNAKKGCSKVAEPTLSCLQPMVGIFESAPTAARNMTLRIESFAGSIGDCARDPAGPVWDI